MWGLLAEPVKALGITGKGLAQIEVAAYLIEMLAQRRPGWGSVAADADRQHHLDGQQKLLKTDCVGHKGADALSELFGGHGVLIEQLDRKSVV